MQGLWYEIPRLSREESDLIGYIAAWIILIVTLFFRRACYISFKKEDELLHKLSYTQKKKRMWENKQKKKQEWETSQKDIESWDDGETSSQEDIKIYVDKEIK